MCVIIHLLPNKTIDREQLYNAAANNWHSWGIIIKDEEKKTLEVIKRLPKDAHLLASDVNCGGVWKDLDEIIDILDKNKHLDRIVHFRWASQGEVNEKNVHPMELYKSDSREVWMCHNGTFSGFYSSPHNNYNGQGAVGDSDTRKMSDQFLIPALSDEGFSGNYTNPIYQKFVWDKIYNERGANSRVLFIANDLPIARYGKWETCVEEDNEVSFYASNNEYFSEVKGRSPIFIQRATEERLKKEEADKERQALLPNYTNTGGNNQKESSTVTSFDPKIFRPDPEITKGLTEIFHMIQGKTLELSANELSDLYSVTQQELSAIVEEQASQDNLDVITAFIQYLLLQINAMNTHTLLLESKKKKAEQEIIRLKNEKGPDLKIVGGFDVG